MMARGARIGLPVLAVVVFGAVFGWFPARSASSDAHVRTDAAQRIVEELTWEIDDLGPLTSTVDELRSEYERNLAAVPPDGRLAEFILDLEALSDRVGTEVVDVVPMSVLGAFDDLATPPGTSSIMVGVALNGGFAETIRFLDELSKLPRLVVTESIAIGFDEVAGTLAVDLELRLFTTEELVESTDEFLDDDVESDIDVDGGDVDGGDGEEEFG
jgi:hypothetical protein